MWQTSAPRYLFASLVYYLLGFIRQGSAAHGCLIVHTVAAHQGTATWLFADWRVKRIRQTEW